MAIHHENRSLLPGENIAGFLGAQPLSGSTGASPEILSPQFPSEGWRAENSGHILVFYFKYLLALVVRISRNDHNGRVYTVSDSVLKQLSYMERTLWIAG